MPAPIRKSSGNSGAEDRFIRIWCADGLKRYFGGTK